MQQDPLTRPSVRPSEVDGRFTPKQDRIKSIETVLVKPRWLFLKMTTEEGIVGLGEPLLEGRSLTCQTAVKELEPWLIGEDPTRVVHLWQAMYKHAFYRGGPILTSALSGVEQALWDCYGKLMGLPVYRLLGGPTRDKIRVYGTAGGRDPESAAQSVREAVALGFTAIKTGTGLRGRGRMIETAAHTERVVDIFRAMREAAGPEVDIAIDFHGAVSPQTAKRLVHALEPLHPFFIEEPVQCQNVDVLADITHSTSTPIATGERLFTKWGFRDVLEKRAASILQPDLSHAGGIMETRLIAGMAEAYYAGIAPHCPLGPIAFASCLQLDAAIPNFLCQEGGRHATPALDGYLKTPFRHEGGFVPLPTAPGLGIELDEESLEAKGLIGHDWQNPKAWAEDGAAIDW
jgi:galactonate dehydratase